MTYYYKGKPYRIVAESKIKASGVIEWWAGKGKFAIHPAHEWIDVVIYECLYDNPDGMVWVRTKEQFYNLFTTEP